MEYDRGNNPQRHPVNPFSGEIHVVDVLCPVDTGVFENHQWHVLPKHCIGSEQQDNDWDNNAQRPTDRFQKHRDQDSTKYHINECRISLPQDLLSKKKSPTQQFEINFVPGNADIKRRGDSGNDQQPVPYGDIRKTPPGIGMQFLGALPPQHRVENKYQDNHTRHVKTHMPIVDWHTCSSRHIVICGKKNRKQEGELDQPGTDGSQLKA